jgi:class 3 adenylate cyclase
MNTPARVLIVDDNDTNREILARRLTANGYEVLHARDGEEALAAARQHLPDLILLDVMMPKLDGVEVCRRLKSDSALPFTPIILVTAKSDTKDVVSGLEAGADDYVTKPVDQLALVARVRSALRMKALHDQVQALVTELSESNRTLEQRIARQIVETERMSRLKRFLAPQIADLVISSGDERMLESHRRDITVVFCDLRGFTAFAESAEPEEVKAILSEYHADLGKLIYKFEGTLERFLGDGLMVLFNDPLECADPSGQAVRMAVEMRSCVAEMATKWRHEGFELGFGIGIARGYATVGRIGFEGRADYTAIGTVVNIAARLCSEAGSDQILVDPKVWIAVEAIADTEPVGELTLKGLHRPIRAYNVRGLRA